MLTLFSGILGFAGSFLPSIVKFFTAKEDHKHELAVLNVQAQMQAQGHIERIEEINVNADIAESQALYKPDVIQVTGNKFIDFLEGLLHFYNGTVRPTVTYAFVVFYGLVVYAKYSIAMELTTNKWTAIKDIYTEYDMSILTLCLGYYFGQRMVAKAAAVAQQMSPAKNLVPVPTVPVTPPGIVSGVVIDDHSSR